MRPFFYIVLALFVLVAGVVWLRARPEAERKVSPEVAALAELVAAAPDSFLAAADSLLAHADLDDPEVSRSLEQAAEAYVVERQDSLLVSDLRMARSLDSEQRAAWYRAFQVEAEGEHLKAEGDHEGSEQSFLQALAVYRDVGDRRRAAIVLGSIGTSWWYRGDLETAMAWYQRALYHRRQIGADLLVGRALNTLGTLNYQLWEFDSALVYYEKARAVRTKLDRPRDLATTLSYLGNVHLDLDDPARARKSYLEAVRVGGEDLSASNLVKIHMGLASTFATIGDYGQALHHDQLALIQARATGDPQDLAGVRKNLGSDYLRLERHREALIELRQAEQLQREEGLYDLEVTLNEIGNVYDQLGDLDRAFESWNEALILAEENENAWELIGILLNLALGHAKQERFGKAESHLDRALSLSLEYEFLDLERDVWARKSDVRFGQRRFEESLELQKKALEIDQELGLGGQIAEDLANIGMLETALGDIDVGRKTLREALARVAESGRKDMLWLAYMNLADNFEQAGVLDSARANNARALAIIEGSRSAAFSEATRADFLAARSVAYEAQQHVLAQMHERDPKAGYAEEGLDVMERGKSQALLEMLTESREGVRLDSKVEGRMATIEQELRDVQHDLSILDSEAPRETIRELTSRQELLERGYSDLQEQLRLEDPRFDAVSPGRPARLDEIRDELLATPRSVVLEYALGDSASYLWAITRNGLDLHRLPPRPVIDVLARDYLLELRKRERDRRGAPPVAEAASEATGIGDLSSVLLAPVRELIDSADALFIVADGSLHGVPFEALNTPGEPGRYALANLPVRYGPSATSLIRLKAMRRAEGLVENARCLAVGDPVFTASIDASPAVDEEDEQLLRVAGSDWGQSELSPLPHTRTEIEAIATMFPPERITVLLGEEARESVFRDSDFLGRFDVLHVATHGFANPRWPERSRLALSYPRDAEEDGYLQASEIYRLELKAQLVVLSACRTGMGRNVRGEGVLGLPRAFFYAGVPNVVVSLWNVSDRATAELMTHFYKGMIEEGLPPADALAGAKEELRGSESFAHPFYWAAFVLMGPG